MVVMDYVNGMTADILEKHKLLPSNFFEEVEKILSHLHNRGYVFGDLRSPNVMVRDDDRKVMFIDFDWVGKDGESTYPIIMSESISWPQGV